MHQLTRARRRTGKMSKCWTFTKRRCCAVIV
jgi:hypothetical protein